MKYFAVFFYYIHCTVFSKYYPTEKSRNKTNINKWISIKRV